MRGYSFNASAIGLGGVLSSGGVRTTIPSLASVALAPTGGEGSAVVENYNANGISFSRAETRVFGAELDENIYTTYSDVYITNLTIFDRLKIALMGATISSTRNVTTAESYFDVRVIYRGIAVEGAPVIPVLDGALCNAPTYQDVQTAMNGRLAEYAQSWGVDREALSLAVANSNPRDPLGGTLVSDLQIPAGVALSRVGPHAIEVPGVGRVHFGEFLFKPGRRRVNLLRIKFGSTTAAGDEGDLTGGSVEGNGSPPYP